ncbi:putative kinetoplast polyadenylation/uridylation factor 2 [Leptomonas seymouri]|uniref:Putative kinetoplast polyadenylation/uridylation factor 2 n=1 Tax=Leptomonas seymouri TaxID=5684 RepID=A0A0N1PGR3_LEPSE|nr:putative kinetoplast polyadenylation/uridylation factor 2 [Leptomonas seymouri]|eukprot:KPI90851.1 putative kinetoplast polyadenylation/uridylation factor 2 [Leptomonas seymouri]
MPALTAYTRLLPILPGGPPACTHIYRLCTSAATPQQPAPAQPAALNASVTGAPSPASARTSPASLDLGLNFATMDFDAVAKATQAAIARERGIGAAALSAQRDQDFESKLERQSEQSGRQLSTPPITSSPAPQASSNASFGAPHHGNRAQSAAVTITSGRGFARESARRTTHPHSDNVTKAHYSLQDLLKDCLVEGNWAKSYQLFLNAVNQACRQVLVANNSSGILANPAQWSSSSIEQAGSAREAECFAALKKMLASLPPTNAPGVPAAPSRRPSVKNLRGITRWNGQHYYMLWKCLLEACRLEEVQHVWSVMQQIGFAEYHMEEKTVNMLMALLRRTSRTSEQTTTQILSSAFTRTENFDGRIEREKEIRRQLVKDLEQVATARELRLVGSNRRTAENIRIAEALRHVGEGGKTGSDAEGVVADASADPDESIIAVGDFDGLLRRSRSMECTQRVLHMMAKLNLEMESSTFASLIASLHNPQYVLEGHTAEELASHVPATSPAAPSDATEPASTTGASLTRDAAPGEADAVSSCTKTQYEAYKQERVETALRWFLQCPKLRRNADVYNELLYLLRAKSHWRDFDKALVEFRGNAVLSEEEWPETAPARSVPAVPPLSGSAVPVILSARWTTPPNGKTYELLIQRARYVHQWEVMWALYEEMASSRVRGTTRLYEVLLTEAHRHPPRELHGVVVGEGGGGSSRESSELLLRLYEELRRNGGDVHSFKSTLNVVNAWSKSRAKMNRWE